MAKPFRNHKSSPSSPGNAQVNAVSTWQSMSARRASLSTFDELPNLPDQLTDGGSEEHQLLPSPFYTLYSSDTLQATLRDILNPARIAALEACDVRPIPYNPDSLFSNIFTLQGRNFSMTIVPLFVLLLWGVGWELLFIFLPKGDSYNEEINSYVSNLQHVLILIDDLFSKLITPVAFLLVFRLGRASVRFWDARQAAGKMVEICRSNIATATTGLFSPIRLERMHRRRQDKQFHGNKKTSQNQQNSDVNDAKIQISEDGDFDIDNQIELLCTYARWLTAFPVALKHFLRPEERQGWDDNAYYKKRRFEIGSLLHDADANHIIFMYEDEKGNASFDKKATRVRDQPLVVLNRLHELSYEVANAHYNFDKFRPTLQQRAVLYQQLNEQINTLCGSFGTMERIKNTPLPFVYVIHLRTFLLLYLFLWNMTSIARSGWIALPALFAFNWCLLGIEAAAVECERPFDWKANHLTLGRICVVIARNVAQAMKEVRY